MSLPGIYRAFRIRLLTRGVRLAAIRFRSVHGQRFDGFALDIESSSVANVSQLSACNRANSSENENGSAR